MKPLSQTPPPLLAIVAVAAWYWLVPLTALAAESGGSRDADLIAALQPAVVSISVDTRQQTGPVAGNMVSQPTVAEHNLQGSGFFLTASGIIVTNRHTVAGASAITVTLYDATKLTACILATAAQSDLTLLKVNAGRPVATAAFGDSDRLRPGDPVFVIGNPLGLGNTVTAGIVSALDRNTEQSQFGSFFQIDASLNHGNSGGPVFNARGEIVGVATALFTPGGETGSVGLGLSIPSNDARFIVERLLQRGEVRLGWIGAHIQPVAADIAAALGLPSVGGSIVTDVDDDSPAAGAGLKVGDVILTTGTDDAIGPQVLSRRIAGSTIGSTVELAIWRDGHRQTLSAVIGESPEDQKLAKSTTTEPCGARHLARRDLGLVLGPLTASVRGKLGLSPQDTGVQVGDVVADSVAADHGVTAGTVIVSVQRQPVSAPADVQPRIDAARAENRSSVLLLVRDSQGLRWIALPLALDF